MNSPGSWTMIPMNRIIRTLVVDDSPVLRQSLRRFLEDRGPFQVVAEEAGAEAVVESAVREKPDLVVIDVKMPGADVWSIVRTIKALPDAPKVVILTLEDDGMTRGSALDAGADATCGKQRAWEDLLPMLVNLFPGA